MRFDAVVRCVKAIPILITEALTGNFGGGTAVDPQHHARVEGAA